MAASDTENPLGLFGDGVGDGPRRELVTARGGAVAPEKPGTRAKLNAAYIHVAPRSMPLPVLIAVPHAGRAYPGDTLAAMRDPEQSQLRLEDRHVDQVAVALARETGTGLLVAQAPRAMIDLNRAEDDVDWEMIARPDADAPAHRTRRPGRKPPLIGTGARARSGLGLVPRRLPGTGEIWSGKLAREELDRRIDRIHRPYHDFLASELRRIREEWGAALLIDLHSMPPLRQKGAQGEAPAIVIGDRFGAACHSALVSRAFRCLEEAGWRAAHNRPYSGGYVLDRHAAPTRSLHAIQIELCRSAYLDATLSEPTDGVQQLASVLARMVRELGALTAQLGANGISQAAE
ncbi:N-formylglutamate amidohydrolase [Qipengyuania nanhaisediminis]|uniref:N-formylglutamate amidohydrolase n=1 Tax=Qipengyuania nanhaisediminis TaxID=604088 RepID=UPI0038B23F6B